MTLMTSKKASSGHHKHTSVSNTHSSFPLECVKKADTDSNTAPVTLFYHKVQEKRQN